MKTKQLMLAAFAAALVGVPASATDVYSSNIVGYTKVNLTAGLNLIGMQFVNVGATDVAVDDVVTLTGQATYDEEMNAQTELRLWTGSGYSRYEWTGDLSTENPDMAAALEDEMGLTGATAGTYDNKWFFEYEPTDETLSPGEGAWIWASGNGTATFSGEVPSSNTVTKVLHAGLNLVSSPWPVSLPLSSITLSGQATYDEEMNAQTELRLWTGSGYSRYEWTGALSTENSDMAAALEDEMGLTGATAGTYDNKWFFEYEPTTDTIAVGKGFWIWASGSGTITFTRP